MDIPFTYLFIHPFSHHSRILFLRFWCSCRGFFLTRPAPLLSVATGFFFRFPALLKLFRRFPPRLRTSAGVWLPPHHYSRSLLFSFLHVPPVPFPSAELDPLPIPNSQRSFVTRGISSGSALDPSTRPPVTRATCLPRTSMQLRSLIDVMNDRTRSRASPTIVPSGYLKPSGSDLT